MTKTKIKESLKNLFIKELNDKKEKERLERVEQNSNLREITMYLDKNHKLSEDYIKLLEQEGINLTKKIRNENKEEWAEVAATTNFNVIPTFFVNKEYLISGRDFQNPQQSLNALKYLGDPLFNNPSPKDKLFEYNKTQNYQLHTRLTNLEKKLTPMIDFISNLQKELIEEETPAKTPNTEKKGDCGCGKKKK